MSTLLFLLSTSPLYGNEIRYVSDFLIVNIKDSVESPYNIVGTVQSDDKVEVLEKKGRYLKVRTESDVEGWISNQYLKSSVPRKLIIANQKLEISKLSEKLKQYEGQVSALPISSDEKKEEIKLLKFKLAELSKVHQSLQNDYQSLMDNPPKGNELQTNIVTELRNKLVLLEEENRKFKLNSDQHSQSESSDLADKELQKLKLQYTNLLQNSENVGSLTEERDSLLIDNEKFEKLILTLQTKNKALLNKQRLYWFLAGAVVFIFGLLFGKVGSRKKNRFSY